MPFSPFGLYVSRFVEAEIEIERHFDNRSCAGFAAISYLSKAPAAVCG
jgi:hypothetical protein